MTDKTRLYKLVGNVSTKGDCQFVRIIEFNLEIITDYWAKLQEMTCDGKYIGTWINWERLD